MTTPASTDNGTIQDLKSILEEVQDFFKSGEIALSNDADREQYLATLQERMQTGAAHSASGLALITELQNILTGDGDMADKLNTMAEGFQSVRQGLSSLCSTCATAVQNIETASGGISDKLETVKTYLKNLEEKSEGDPAGAEALQHAEAAADDAFTLLMELQFQDILRQQVSAVATLLQETQQRISDSVVRLTGEKLAVASEEDFAITDESVISTDQGQDDIDALINANKP
jgi:hypothetical protein